MNCQPIRNYIVEKDLREHIFLKRALAYIEQHPLFSHRFFDAFEGQKLEIRQVQVWAKQRLFSSKNFPRFLGAFISKLEDEEVRGVYVGQLYEEQGALVSEKIHARQLRNLIFALGVSPEELAKETMLPGTAEFVNAYWELVVSNNMLEAMGGFAFGTEPIVVMEMVRCLKGLEQFSWLTPEDKIYFSDHAVHDYRHTNELLDVILPFITCQEDEESVWRGMTKMLDARKALYDGISEKIGI